MPMKPGVKARVTPRGASLPDAAQVAPTAPGVRPVVASSTRGTVLSVA